MLKFYALYKQAKEGACCESKPGFWDVVKKAKWEAWDNLGQMSKQEAMESYVSELKHVVLNLTDQDGLEEFSEVLKPFYKEVYEGQVEQLPRVLKAFKDEALQNGKLIEFNLNGHSCEPLPGNVPFQNGHVELFDENGREMEFPVSKSGFPHRDSLYLERYPQRSKKTGLSSSKGVNPFLIIPADKVEDASDIEEDDKELQNREPEVPHLRSQWTDLCAPKGQNVLILTSDESDEDEFCDTVDPEHLQELLNGDHIVVNEINLDNTLQNMDSSHSSTLNSSPEGATNSTSTESENSDLESDLKISELLTSTPFAKHVTFAIESSDSDRPIVINSELPKVVASVSEESVLEMVPLLENGCDSHALTNVLEDNPVPAIENGDQKPSGILKSHHPVRECGGGDASQKPSGRHHGGRTWQAQGLRSKEDSSGVDGASGLPKGDRRRGDSDSEDEFASDHTSGPDYDSAGDELNDRILQALERLHQDMKNVVRRLSSIEETVARSQQASHQSTQPWWKAFVPSKPLVFLILWPFIINIIFYYIKRRKGSQGR